MKIRNLALYLLCFVLFFSLTVPASAQDAQPGAADPPPALDNTSTLPAFSDDVNSLTDALPDPAILQAAGLPPLKAVLVVGPIDPPGNTATRQEIANMELAANSLIAHGVQVVRLYTPNDTWASLVANAQGANFLLYRGHGLYWGSAWPTPTVGGFELTERMYTSDDIKRDLKLAPNAIVMLYACLATGSSTTDSGAISQAEARRRVSQYSQPFLDLGAAGYYADWFGDAFQVYIDNLFSGKTLGDSFKNYHDYDPAAAVTTTHLTYTSLPEILSWDNWNPYPIAAPQYNSTFVGQSSKTLWDLFTPALTLSANSITYIAKPNTSPKTYEITVQSSNSVTLSWSATPANGVAPGWVTYTPTTGKSGTVLKITLTPPSSTGKLQTALNVTTSDQTSTQTVNITLLVTNNLSKVFLPSIVR